MKDTSSAAPCPVCGTVNTADSAFRVECGELRPAHREPAPDGHAAPPPYYAEVETHAAPPPYEFTPPATVGHALSAPRGHALSGPPVGHALGAQRSMGLSARL